MSPSPSASIRPTGIALLDEDLGALPPGGALLVLHDPAVDAAPILHHVAHAASEQGRRVVYATAVRDPRAVQEEAARLGLAARAPAVADLRDARDLDEAGRRIEAAGGNHPDAVLLLGINGLAQAFGLDAVRAWWPRWRAAARPGLLATNATTGAHEAPSWVLPDATLHLVRREAQGVRYDAFQAGGSASSRVVPYRIDRPGGLRPTLPKILVTGPHSAGKSTLVKTLSETGVGVELLGTTVALDHGRLERGGLSIDVFGTPGQERFEPIIRQAASGALGVIVVLDSTRPNTFLRGALLADLTSGGKVPVVYAANKQDLPGAAGPEALRAQVRAGPGVPIVPCVASDRAQALRVLDALAAEILRPSPA